MARSPHTSGSSAAMTAPAAAPGGRGDAVPVSGQGRRAFPRPFWVLVVGYFFLLCGVDMCFPFETTYLHDRLGASATTIGLLLGIPLLLAIPFYVVDGAITDRYGRRPAMMIAVCCMAVLYSTLAFATSLWQIALAVMLEAAFGWALFLTACNAMTADLVAVERRAEAYSLIRAAHHLGMVVGPLLAAAVLARDPTYRWLFLSGTAICLLFAVVGRAALRETRPPEAAVPATFRETMGGYAVVLHDRHFMTFCAIALLPLYGLGQIWSVLPVMLREAHGASPRTWGYLLAFYALSVAALQYPVIRWLRDRDSLLLMAVASACVGAGVGGAVLVTWGAPTFVSMFVMGMGVLLLTPISSTVSARLAPVSLRGRYMGAWTLVQMGGYALGPTFGGLAADALGPRGAALLVVGCGLLGAALYVLLAARLRARAATT